MRSVLYSTNPNLKLRGKDTLSMETTLSQLFLLPSEKGSTLTLVLLNQDMPYLCKQMWAWHLNLFSMTRQKKRIRSPFRRGLCNKTNRKSEKVVSLVKKIGRKSTNSIHSTLTGLFFVTMLYLCMNMLLNVHVKSYV